MLFYRRKNKEKAEQEAEDTVADEQSKILEHELENITSSYQAPKIRHKIEAVTQE